MKLEEFIEKAKSYEYTFEPYGFDEDDFTPEEWEEIMSHDGETCKIVDITFDDTFSTRAGYKENFESAYWNVEFDDGYILDGLQGVSLKQGAEIKEELTEKLSKERLKKALEKGIKEIEKLWKDALEDEDFHDEFKAVLKNKDSNPAQCIKDILKFMASYEMLMDSDKSETAEQLFGLSFDEYKQLDEDLEDDIDKLAAKAKEDEEELANLKADAELHNHAPEFESLKEAKGKNRIIWDDCTPTRDRRPTTPDDIEDDIHIEEFHNEEEVFQKLLDLADYEEEDWFEEEDLNLPVKEKIESLLGYFSDPGDGSPNILYLKVNGEVIQDAWYDCLDGLDLDNCSEDEVKQVCKETFSDSYDDEEEWEEDEEEFEDGQVTGESLKEERVEGPKYIFLVHNKRVIDFWEAETNQQAIDLANELAQSPLLAVRHRGDTLYVVPKDDKRIEFVQKRFGDKQKPGYIVIGFDIDDKAQEIYGCSTMAAAERLADILNKEQSNEYGENNIDTYEYSAHLNDGDVVDIYYGPIEESLQEEKSDDIKQFINDLYKLRKDSIEKDGEYGLGNLVFKEFRNRGYLDNLKDQRKVEKGKELSLETLDEGMTDKVKRTTKGFTKDHGQIICNGGEQEKEVVELLKKNGYLVEVVPGKHGSVNIKYNKSDKLKEELGSTFKQEVEMSPEEFEKWKKATKEDVELHDTDFGTLIYIKGANGIKHIGTYLKLFNTLWCDDIGLFGHEIKEVWTNGSGPGFYEPIDHIYDELDNVDFEYEMFQDGEKTYFIVDDIYSNEMQEIIMKWCGDYEVEGPDPTGKVSIVVNDNQLYMR